MKSWEIPWKKASDRRVFLNIFIIRFLVALVFVAEGIQKFVYADQLGVGRFAQIGIPYPEFVAPFVGINEILWGTMILIGFHVRLAAIPLILIMLVALITTKLPILTSQGLLTFIHASRNDLSMLFCCIFLILNGQFYGQTAQNKSTALIRPPIGL